MEYQAIIYEKHGAVAKVITKRPRYKNTQSRLMIDELEQAFGAAAADEEVRVMVHGLDSHTKDKLEGKGFPKVMPEMAKALKTGK